MMDTLIQSLKTWNPENPSSLVDAIQEILLAFQHYHEKLIKNSSIHTIQFEYSTLANVEGLEYLYNKEEREMKLLVPLTIDPKLLKQYSTDRKLIYIFLALIKL
jgi:hypothetical protein